MFSNFILPIVVVCILLLSAYFAACETAMTACSKPKMYKLANDGNKNAKIICELQENVQLVISAILLCNTFFNNLAATITTIIGIKLFGEFAIIYFPVILSIFMVLFVEVLPKMFTLKSPEKILLPSAKFLQFVLLVLTPINVVISKISQIVLPKNQKEESDENASHLDELKGAIALHKGTDDDSVQEKAMLSSILDLGSVQVSKIMVHRKNVTMLCADDDPMSIVEQVTVCPFTRIPLWRDNTDNIVGILHVKDLLKSAKGCFYNLNIMDIASKPWFITENTDLLCQLQEFKKKREHFAVVVDEYGSFLGIVTLEDILEEIVGDISDEHDIDSANSIRLQENGDYIVDGTVNVRDFNRQVGTNFPCDIAATMAGIVINSIGIIPETNQIFVLFDHKFEILKRQRNQITLLKISKIDKQENI